MVVLLDCIGVATVKLRLLLEQVVAEAVELLIR
jgi:hypothetical protein